MSAYFRVRRSQRPGLLFCGSSVAKHTEDINQIQQRESSNHPVQNRMLTAGFKSRACNRRVLAIVERGA
jgi:hypothetical protein